MLEQEIRAEIERIINELGFDSLFVVEIEKKGGETGPGSLKIFLDGLKGVSIDQCASVSRKLTPWLEENDPFRGKFNLEVSSPGADQPLQDRRQFPKHVGRELNLVLSDGAELKGKLEKADQELLLINVKGRKRELKFEEIDKAKVLISF